MQMAQQARRTPETIHDIKLKTNSRQAGKLTVLTFSNFPLPPCSLFLRTQRQTTFMFHMQLVVSTKKENNNNNKNKRAANNSNWQLATG